MRENRGDAAADVHAFAPLSLFVGLVQPVAMVTRYGVTTVRIITILLKDVKLF